MGKEHYKHTKERVAEITGVSLQDKQRNFHHIIGRAEYARNKEFWDRTCTGHFDVDGLANVFPVTLRQHEWINQRTESLQLSRKKRKHR